MFNENMKYGICLLLLATLIAACSDSGKPLPVRHPDAKAIAANNHAVGLMGQFDYVQAQALFADLVLQWPDWLGVKVNLAIATLNRQQTGDELVALDMAGEVLQAEPANVRAHYIAGLMKIYLGTPADARPHFEHVVKADPKDAFAAYYLAQCLAQKADYQQALRWYQRAMELDPYLRSAYYGAFQSLQRLKRGEQASAVAADYQRLDSNPRSHLAEFKYTRMGPKAETLAFDLASESIPSRPEGAIFMGPTPLLITNPSAIEWHQDFEGRTPSFTTVDMQNDGRPDLFLASVVEIEADSGTTVTGNLVLEGQAAGGYSVRSNHPLAKVSKVRAALWGDFDNDGLVDVYLCRHGQNQLWRQTATNTWQNVTLSTGTAGGDLDTVDGAFFDADHDGDLDLYLVNADGPNELLNNNLDGSFRPLATDHHVTGGNTESVMVLPTDLDNDRDVDLIVLNRNAPHRVYVNDRLWSYHPAVGYEEFINSPALSVLAADMDVDGLIELYTVKPDGELLRWQTTADGKVRSESLGIQELLTDVTRVQMATFDVNGDGALELIISSAKGWTALAVHQDIIKPLYSVTATPGAAHAASLPFLDTSLAGPGILVFSAEANGLSHWKPGPGRYPFVTLTLSGKQDEAQSMRSNASGVGVQLAVRAGSRWSRIQNYRNHSAPGQSLQPLAVGLKGARRADFIAIDWSDGVFQSEVNVETGRLQQITETQRQLSSCPVLFAWDGKEYAFVSDVLGVGGIGYAIGPGEYSTPRPWENFLLPAGLLRPKNDRYILKISEPMEEIAYLDSARLAIYDLPPGWHMVLDERMGIAGPEPTGEAQFYRQEMLPIRAVNDRGDEILETILARDGVAAPVGKLDQRFIGRLQAEHSLTLEFPQPLESYDAAPLLVIDGWVEYPYSQTNFAAWQAGAQFAAPSLDAAAQDGKWQQVMEQFGYPAGMPRRMSLPLSGLPKATTQLRLRTNMQVYWDRIAVVFTEPPPEHKKKVLTVAAATLKKPGFAKRSTFDQFRPDYDYAALSPFWDTRYMTGHYTRLGPIDELLVGVDDAVAIIGPGEEVHLEFDATESPPPPPGWSRSFVLEINGWAKDMDLFTRDGETVGPLPSTGKPTAVRDKLHARYNTRYQSGF